MKRRTYLAGLGVGSLGFGLGTQAAVDIWADRDTNISVTTDADGLIGFKQGTENGQFATQGSNGALSIDVSTGRANGLNPKARTTIDDIFRIRNQASDDQVVWIKDITDDGKDLFGDEGPLHFFRGPVEIKGFDTSEFRITSQIDPVPGTPNGVQRLSIVGLVPPVANIGRNASAQLAWINSGHPVTRRSKVDEIDQSRRRNRPITAFYGDNVQLAGGAQVGTRKGRFFLEPGEEMIVGLDADFRDFDDVTIGLNEIQIVSRSVDDAITLARGEFDATQTD